MLEVTEADVQRILDHHRGRSIGIAEFCEIKQHGFGAFTSTQTFLARVDDGTSYILKAATATTTSSESYLPNSLESEHKLLKLVAAETDIPTPTIRVLDTSATLVPYQYLLLAHPGGVSLALARTSGKLSQRQASLLDLLLGSYLKQLHERVQNDWFGLPSQENAQLYTWQEAFMLLLETLLDDALAADVVLPYEDLRRYLSRAIGSFLFDDCEVPSLVSFAGDEYSTFADFDLENGQPEDEEVRVTSFASVGHALWGDPLLEALFLEPSAALLKGYGGTLIVFARQKTKRLWYTFFLALVILVQAKRLGMGEADHEKVRWAKETAEKCVAELKDAPCY